MLSPGLGGGREVLSPGSRRGLGRCCDLVLAGGVVTWVGEGGVVTWVLGGGGGRCCDLVLGGGRCCHLGPGGREVLSPGPRGGRCCHLVLGGVVTWMGGGRCCHLGPGWCGGGRCCDLVLGGGRCCHLGPEGERGVVTWVQRGREVLSPRFGGGGVVTWSGGEGGVVTWLPTSTPGVEVTHTCENITFARFATCAVINVECSSIESN